MKTINRMFAYAIAASTLAGFGLPAVARSPMRRSRASART
jgi:hypothetical protein